MNIPATTSDRLIALGIPYSIVQFWLRKYGGNISIQSQDTSIQIFYSQPNQQLQCLAYRGITKQFSYFYRDQWHDPNQMLWLIHGSSTY